MIKILIISSVVVTALASDPASDQLPNFKNKTKGPIGILTTDNGSPVEIRYTTSLNGDFMNNDYFLETLTHQFHEKIPERIVLPKGAGAFGYFEVTDNLTDICSASLFESDGKVTPVAVRFALGNAEKGESDTIRNSRGFSIKFYTDAGNLDFVLFHTPIFMFKDPQLFTSVTKAMRRNPQTNLRDPNMLWDYIANTPEVLPYFLNLQGDVGTPDGFIHLAGYSIHTYQVYNKFGESYFVRFHFHPDSGIKNLIREEAKRKGCSDPDYATRGLFNAIAKGDYPSWTLKVQVLTFEDLKNCKFDPFDITKELPEDIYPLRTVGKLVLNKNPLNYFAQVEQLAFCPCNLVKGILGAPDNVFKARRFYKEAQRYRLGGNYQTIIVNKPLTKVYTYQRDGIGPVERNGGSGPNYARNSFNGPVPYVDKSIPKLIKIRQYHDSFNFEQVTERFVNMSKEERERLIGNIVDTLKKATKSVQDNVIELFKSVHLELAFSTIAGLTEACKK